MLPLYLVMMELHVAISSQASESNMPKEASLWIRESQFIKQQTKNQLSLARAESGKYKYQPILPLWLNCLSPVFDHGL